MGIVIDFLQLGMIYGIVTLALVISFRIIGFADLTIEGSFSLGGAVAAVSLHANLDPVTAVLLSILAGGIAGFFTAAIHCFIGINKLISGIITLTILYTANLRIMEKPNFQLLDIQLLFDSAQTPHGKLFMLMAIMAIVFVFLLWLLSTNFGLHLRATGENLSVVQKAGFNPKFFIIVGLILSNGLVAMSGAILAQVQGFSDISMGGGLLIGMLASLLIGENILPPTSVFRLLAAALIGAIAFQAIISIALRLGIHPWDLKLAIGIFFVLTLMMEKIKNRKKLNLNIGSDFL
jgi:putative ABC transport system permease protein